MIQQKNLVKAGALKQIEKLQASLPEGENLVVNYKDGMPVVSGIESAKLQQSISLEGYNKQIAEINKQQQTAFDKFNPNISTDILGQNISNIPKDNTIQIDSRTGKPYGELTIPQQDTRFLERTRQKLQDWRSQALSETNRGESSFKTQALGIVGGFGSGLADNLIFGRDLVSSPIQTTRNVVSGVKTGVVTAVSGEGFPGVGAMLMNEPGYTAGYIGGDWLSAKAGGYLFDKTSKFTKNTLTKLSPNYVPVSQVDDTRFLRLGDNWIDDTTDIQLLGKGDDIAMDLSSQARLAGTTQNIVSAQRDLFGFFDNTKTLRKPIPGEEKLSIATKNLLKRFDEGTLPANRLDDLNQRIIKETGSKGLLERSFFADPYGRARTSRITQTPKKANWLDIMSGDVTTKATKPQLILMRDVKIADLPPYLDDVKNKLLNKQALTVAEANRLRRWQLKGNEVKPIGFLSPEPEVTIPGGSIIKKKGTAAVTVLDGQRVKVIESSLVGASDDLNKLLIKRNTLGLDASETKKLGRLLEKESGLSYNPSTSPYLNPYKTSIGASVLLSGSPQSSTTSSLSMASSSISPSSSYSPLSSPSSISPVSGSSSYVLSPPGKPSPSGSSLGGGSSYLGSGASGGSGGSGYSPLKKADDLFKQERDRRRKPQKKKDEDTEDRAVGYVTQVKEYGKWKTVVNKALKKKEAQRLGQYVVDNTLSAQFRIKPTKKSPAKQVLKMMMRDQKFRDYKIRKGSKVPMKNQFIEFSKYRLDKPGEKRTLQQFRKSAQYKKAVEDPLLKKPKGTLKTINPWSTIDKKARFYAKKPKFKNFLQAEKADWLS